MCVQLLLFVQVYSLRYGVDITSGHLCAGPDPGTVTGTCVVSPGILCVMCDV